MLMVCKFKFFSLTRGIDNEFSNFNSPELSLKRKTSDSTVGPPAKQQKTIYPAYFIPELAHVVAMCDEKLPFVCLARELSKRKIPHSGLQVEANATSLVLKLLSLPQPGSQQITPENKVSTSMLEQKVKNLVLIQFFVVD